MVDDEQIRDGVVREVYEETGIRTKFEGILGMREQLEYNYGASDLYMVCLVSADKVQDIGILDKLEVCNAKWVPFTDLEHNGEGCKYKLFPNAFMFIKIMKELVEKWKE